MKNLGRRNLNPPSAAVGLTMVTTSPLLAGLAEVAYRGEVPVIGDKREVMAKLPNECNFIEPQDFRADDDELFYSCMDAGAGGNFTISVMGSKLSIGKDIIYRKQAGEYNEVEGIAPGGAE